MLAFEERVCRGPGNVEQFCIKRPTGTCPPSTTEHIGQFKVILKRLPTTLIIPSSNTHKARRRSLHPSRKPLNPIPTPLQQQALDGSISEYPSVSPIHPQGPPFPQRTRLGRTPTRDAYLLVLLPVRQWSNELCKQHHLLQLLRQSMCTVPVREMVTTRRWYMYVGLRKDLASHHAKWPKKGLLLKTFQTRRAISRGIYRYKRQLLKGGRLVESLVPIL